MEDMVSFYKDKRVLVTGHTGFKGSWLCLWLDMLGAKVTGIGLEPHTNRDNYVVSGVSNLIEDKNCDIRQAQSMQEIFDKASPEIVFHLAAQPLVRYSYEHPEETYETNVMGTMNVLSCIRNTPSVKAAVMITTDKCYENKESIWAYRENDPLGGYDPYSSSKACCEILISSYRDSFLNPCDYDKHGKLIASARAGNVIGGGDWAEDRIVPDCIRALEKDETILLRNPHSTRPYQHVLEPLYGYLMLGMGLYNGKKELSGGWNFGPDTDSVISTQQLAKLIIDSWGQGAWKDVSTSNAPHEAGLLSLDCTKARVKLSWTPRLTTKEAVEMTVEWYKNYKGNAYNICKAQIEEYMRKCSSMK